MPARASASLTRTLVTIGLCSLVAACTATGGAFSPQMLTRLVPPQTPATGTASSGESMVAATAFAGGGFSDGASLRPAQKIAQPAAPPMPRRVAARSAVEAEGYSEVGLASWYGSQFHGRSTANGETFNRLALTAAHRSLPLPSYVRVTNLENNRSITVRINDRGPYAHNRLIDVSEQTAELLAFRRGGTTRVKVDYVGPAAVDADDGQTLLATYRGPSRPAATRVAARPQPTRVAFANETDGGANEPMERLTTRPSVLNRILMAFDVASFGGN